MLGVNEGFRWAITGSSALIYWPGYWFSIILVLIICLGGGLVFQKDGKELCGCDIVEIRLTQRREGAKKRNNGYSVKNSFTPSFASLCLKRAARAGVRKTMSAIITVVHLAE